MKITKNTFGLYFLKTEQREPLSLHKDFHGVYQGATLTIESLDMLIKNTDSTVLEDLFHSVNCELQMRDRAWCEKNL